MTELLPTDLQGRVEDELINWRYPWVVQFDRPVGLCLTAKLGDIQSNDAEDYIPLVVTKVECWPPRGLTGEKKWRDMTCRILE